MTPIPDSITPEMITIPATSSLSLRRKSTKQLQLSLSKPSKRQRVTLSTPQHHTSYHQGPIAILPYLFIGNETNAHSLDQLNGIDCLLNVAAEKLNTTHSAKGYYKLATRQHGEQIRLNDAMALIDQAKKHKKVVLVHCQCGVARSATVVIGYIMHSLHLSLHDAYSFVQLRAPAIGPNLALLYQLQSLERLLLGCKKENSSNKTIGRILRKRKLETIC
ncbi:protein-tyrosine phosphatase-like protein [Chlamydoabsidia padenii]|nr:protein-tyrosine phosphatase-like protein [Chlamydoabsidia padenii]